MPRDTRDLVAPLPGVGDTVICTYTGFRFVVTRVFPGYVQAEAEDKSAHPWMGTLPMMGRDFTPRYAVEKAGGRTPGAPSPAADRLDAIRCRPELAALDAVRAELATLARELRSAEPAADDPIALATLDTAETVSVSPCS
jgi:hypothetical protein